MDYPQKPASEVLAQLQGAVTVEIEGPKDYASLSEYVDHLNKMAEISYSTTSGGGIMGAYTTYSLITYKRNGKDCEGYKRTTGSAVGNITNTTYYDNSGVDITNKIQAIGEVLYYEPDVKEIVMNLWPLAIATAVVVVVLIMLIVKHKKQ